MSSLRKLSRIPLNRLTTSVTKPVDIFYRQFSYGSQKLYQEEKASQYDIVITGGGMVGAAMAASLGNEPLLGDKRVLLLEGGPPKSFTSLPDTFSNRTCALSPATTELLSSFGAWENICNMRYQEVKKMQVWDTASDSMITFNREDLMDNLSYIVENDVILGSINHQLAMMSDIVEIRYNSRVASYKLPSPGEEITDEENHYAEIRMADGEKIQTNLVIGADGFKSLLRQTADIHTVQWEYNQFAVVAVLKISETLENTTAWQRFMKTGPIAMLPLSSDYSCLIWTTSPGDAKNLLSLDDDSFVDAVNGAFWTNEGKDPLADYCNRKLDDLLAYVGMNSSASRQLPPTVTGFEPGSRGMFPLGLCHASQYVKSRMALIGDAAHRVHPLAGQGVNLGFGDVACLRDQLTKAIANGSDLGSLQPLLAYETARQRAVVPVVATVDGLQKLYGTSFAPAVLARTLGLQATNALAPLKDQIMKHAMT